MRFSTGKTGFSTGPAGRMLSIVALLVCFASTSGANDGITSNAVIHRAGLTVDWYTHTGAGVSGRLVDWNINVDENKPTTFFTIHSGEYQEKFSQNTLNSFGKPFGIEGARDYAGLRVEILKAEFENDGIKDPDIKVSEYTLPQTTVYVLTSNSIVKAIDGDSGEIKWTSQIGDPSLPSIGLGSNDDYVAAVNGSRLYCLDSKNGKIKWSAKCRYAVSAAPTVSDEKIYVPLFNGRLEAFELAKNGQSSYAFVSKGRGTARPLVTEKTVAWPTSTGDMNVAAKYGEKSGVAYQLRSDNAIVSTPAFKEGMFYVSSLDGFVYAVEEERGVIVWQLATGSSISQAPVALGNYIFVINGLNQLFKIDAKTGREAAGWEEPRINIARYIGAGKENLYLIDVFGNLVVMSQDTGSKLSTVEIGSVKSILPNLESDRLYVVSKHGTIQCIREIGSPIPYFHSNEFVAVEVDPANRQPGSDDQGQLKPGEVDLDDPFGTGVKKPAAPGFNADDPFGGVKPDPAAGDPDDPFGGVKPDPAGSGNKGAAGSIPDEDDPFK